MQQIILLPNAHSIIYFHLRNIRNGDGGFVMIDEEELNAFMAGLEYHMGQMQQDIDRLRRELEK